MGRLSLEKIPNIPPFGGQKGLDFLDKEIYAIFSLKNKNEECPYWTWYVVEFDPFLEEAYGILIGEEIEWGYFSLKELEELGATPRFQEVFPIYFRQLKESLEDKK